jgi:Concanavalin A-like lectin/glucanases superfamily/Fn3 associated
MRTLTRLILLFWLASAARAVTPGDGPGGVGTTDGTSEMELWLKADSLVLASGAQVGAWNDSSGNGRTLVQGSAGLRPVFTAAAGNGLPVVRFTADWFQSLALPAAGNEFAVAAVVKPVRTGAYHNIIDDEDSGRPMLWVDPSGNYEWNFNSGGVFPAGGGYDLVFAIKRGPGPQYSQLHVNGPAVSSGSGVNFTVAGSEVFDFFNRDGGQAFTGDVAELIVFSTALTAEEIGKIGWCFMGHSGPDDLGRVFRSHAGSGQRIFRFVISQAGGIARRPHVFGHTGGDTDGSVAGGRCHRYTLNNTPPAASAPAYTSPLTLTANTRLRARVFESGLNPGPELRESYLKLGADLQSFSSNLSLVFLYSEGAIAPANAITLTSADAAVIAVDELSSRAAAAGSPHHAGRGGLRLRGNLDNDGDTVVLLATDGAEIARIHYRDSWTPAADGRGYTLTLRDPSAVPADYSAASAWGLSGNPGGTPGEENGVVFTQEFQMWRHFLFSAAELDDAQVSGPLADPDGDGNANLVEFACAASPLDGASVPRWSADPASAALTFIFTRARRMIDVSAALEVSGDLAAWTPAGGVSAEILSSTPTTETVRLTASIGSAGRRFVRLRVMMAP